MPDAPPLMTATRLVSFPLVTPRVWTTVASRTSRLSKNENAIAARGVPG
jgi:hypothetical protein